MSKTTDELRVGDLVHDGGWCAVERIEPARSYGRLWVTYRRLADGRRTERETSSARPWRVSGG